jgi:hypothetical protein
LWNRPFHAGTYVGSKEQCNEIGCLSNPFHVVLLYVPLNSSLETLDIHVAIEDSRPAREFHWDVSCPEGDCAKLGLSGYGTPPFDIHLKDLGFPADSVITFTAGDNRTFPGTLVDSATPFLTLTGTAGLKGGPARHIELREHRIDFMGKMPPCATAIEPDCNGQLSATDYRFGPFDNRILSLNLTATWNATPLDQSIEFWIECQPASDCAGGQGLHIAQGPSPLHFVIPDLWYERGYLVIDLIGENGFPESLATARTPIHVTGSFVEEIPT